MIFSVKAQKWLEKAAIFFPFDNFYWGKCESDGVEKCENHSHGDGVSAESVEDVGGPGEIQNQLSRPCVLHIFNL